MEPIRVPAPEKSSFNKHRRVSDLLLSQLKHFQHVAQKQGIEIDAALPREIHTEGGAARYIAAMTRAVKERGFAMQKGTVAPAMQLVSKPIKPASEHPSAHGGLAIAAAGDDGNATNLEKKKTASSKTKSAVKKAVKRAGSKGNGKP